MLVVVERASTDMLRMKYLEEKTLAMRSRVNSAESDQQHNKNMYYIYQKQYIVFLVPHNRMHTHTTNKRKWNFKHISFLSSGRARYISCSGLYYIIVLYDVHQDTINIYVLVLFCCCVYGRELVVVVNLKLTSGLGSIVLVVHTQTYHFS